MPVRLSYMDILWIQDWRFCLAIVHLGVEFFRVAKYPPQEASTSSTARFNNTANRIRHRRWRWPMDYAVVTSACPSTGNCRSIKVILSNLFTL